ncbi:MAG: uracil-DNA glycosylase, partial [Collinsella sp.]|nr:uracil-DNA glycosylase [Collinsella sp.]
MRVSCIAFTERGYVLAERTARALSDCAQTGEDDPGWDVSVSRGFGEGKADLRAWTALAWEASDALLFVGAAGKYLNELLAIAGLSREDVYIANVLKCRPPSNRDPRPEEIQACTPFLREQTRTINPEYIVTLGNVSTKFILKTDVGITRLHGTLQRAGRFKVFPIFHPAAA